MSINLLNRHRIHTKGVLLKKYFFGQCHGNGEVLHVNSFHHTRNVVMELIHASAQSMKPIA